ncbi:MAG: FHA domain-containing protein [Acidobacteria bacterium]|nr:FHA domain-containing protein [Acidobacteriota bacterium]
MQGLLSVFDPGGQGSRVAIKASPFLIGRQTGNHLVLRDNRVSRVHARILNEGGAFFLEDAQSRNGTFLNGRQITQPTVLAEGDSIEFGVEEGYRLVFEPREDTAGVARLAEHLHGTSMSKLRALTEVARAVHGALSMEEVLEAVVEAALSVTGCSRGFLFLARGAELDLRVSRNGSVDALSGNDHAVIQRALNNPREAMQAASHGIAVPLVKVRPASSQETMYAPLSAPVGVLYLDSDDDAVSTAAGGHEILQTLALEAASVIENARLIEQERVKLRQDEELRIARDIQRTLLPAACPQSGWFRAAASSSPSLQVGGDYYDVLQRGPDLWVFVMADVSGKGVSSALMAALLQGALIAAPGDPEGISQLLARINAYIYERAEGAKYATLFYGAMHRSGSLYWCSAGHGQASLVLPDGRVKALMPPALPVGMLDVGEFGVTGENLVSGAKVVVYSDGISDAENPRGEAFGMARVNACLRAGAGESCGELHARLDREVRVFADGVPHRDDMTILIGEYRRGE